MDGTPPRPESGQDRVYEFEASATWFVRMDDGVVQDVITAITQVLCTYGGTDAYVEVRELHRAE